MLAAAPAVAEDVNFETRAPGSQRCADWTRDLGIPNGPGIIAKRSWLVGYASAYRVYATAGSRLATVQTPQLFGGLDRYCAAHPDTLLQGAAEALIAELVR